MPREFEQVKYHLLSSPFALLKLILLLQSAQNTRPENMCELPDFVLRCRCSRISCTFSKVSMSMMAGWVL